MRNNIIKQCTSVLFAGFCLTACGQTHQHKQQADTLCNGIQNNQSLVIHQGWVRAPQKGQKITAAYFTICNQTGDQDRLLSITTAKAAAAELHETKTLEEDRVSMQRVDDLTIPPKAGIALKPGGYHIMLIDLESDVASSDTLTLNLTFENAGPISAKLPLKKSSEEHAH